LPLACLDVQGAQAEVTVRLQRTHAKLVGQGESLVVVGFGRADFTGLVQRSEVAKQP
jgi:hypothetical protein